jgi:hypothetical protein
MLIVKAAPGIKAPLAHKPKSYITDARIVEVEESHYYTSMIKDGDLIVATDAEWAAQQDADAQAEADAIAAVKKTQAAAAKAAKATDAQ